MQPTLTAQVDADVHELAIAAMARETIATAHARKKYPKWKHAKTKAVADAKICRALNAMQSRSQRAWSEASLEERVAEDSSVRSTHDDQECERHLGTSGFSHVLLGAAGMALPLIAK